MRDRRREPGERDPKPLGELLDGLIAGRGWRERMAVGRLRAEWATIVGPDVAARSEPLKLVGGVLSIRAQGAWATELTLLSATLADRVDAYLGAGSVREVRVVSGALPHPS